MKTETATADVSTASSRKSHTIAAIIALYNGAQYIESSLQSVLTQTRPPDEIIIVDDGSTDDGPAIVERYSSDARPITLLRKPNGGQSSARNVGVKHSKSDLIALLDQDDAWYPDHLEKLAEPFEVERVGPPLGWVYGNLDLIDENGLLVTRSFLHDVRVQVEHPKTSLRKMLAGDMMILPCSSLIAKEAYEKVGGFDERLCGYEDDDLFLRIFREGYDNLFVDKALGCYRWHEKSASFSSRYADSQSIYCRKLFEMFGDYPMMIHGYGHTYLVPRFYPKLLRQIYPALLGDDGWRFMDRVIGDLTVMLPYLPPRTRQKVKFLITLRKYPALAKAFYKTYHLGERFLSLLGIRRR